MDVANFDFDLPRDRIAARPARPRDAARLLVVGRDRFEDRMVRALPDLLRPGDVLVHNDARVMPARLRGRRRADRGEASIEVTLDRPLGDGAWSALARPARRLRAGDRVTFPGLDGRVVERRERGEVVLRFAAADAEVVSALERVGEVPLPPYLGRAADEADRDDYQTVYARAPGAVAAPTAGLHFTPNLLSTLARRGIGRAFATLRVGAGTFLPVAADETALHVPPPEWGEITPEAAATANAARAAGGRIVAVGTTSLRLLETAATEEGEIRPFRGTTALFLTPGHRFRTAELLLTNFHLPRSTLFMLACAFAGTARMQAAYRHAVQAGYRFYSYGDACLLTSAAP